MKCKVKDSQEGYDSLKTVESVYWQESQMWKD